MTEEEAAAVEAETLASQEAEVGSCGTWSAWEPSGGEVCRPRISCGSYCDEYGCVANGGAYQQLQSYRVCFDQYGNYTHTEYQYKSGTTFLYCGC